jgi:uncharacterized protein (TIGR00730 family)
MAAGDSGPLLVWVATLRHPLSKIMAQSCDLPAGPEKRPPSSADPTLAAHFQALLGGFASDDELAYADELSVHMARDARQAMRMTAEIIHGFDQLAGLGPAVTVFGSARTPVGHPDYEAARRIGRLLADNGVAVITGGGPGIMEAANRGAMEAGGTSVGLGIKLPMEEAPNPHTTLAVDFRYFFTRKLMLAKYARGFIICPGGIGTMDEFAEVFTLMQTRKMDARPFVLYGPEYWEGLLTWMKHAMVDAGRMSASDFDFLSTAASPREAVVQAIRGIRGA